MAGVFSERSILDRIKELTAGGNRITLSPGIQYENKFAGDNKGLGSIKPPPGGFPTRAAQIGSYMGEGIDQAIEIPAMMGSNIAGGISDIYDYFTSPPEATKIIQQYENFPRKFKDPLSPEEEIQAQLNALTKGQYKLDRSKKDPIDQKVELDRGAKDPVDTSTTTETGETTQTETNIDAISPITDEQKKRDDEDAQRGAEDTTKDEPKKEGKSYLEQLTEDTAKSYVDALKGEEYQVGTIEDYKKEFAEATGIDISGKPDMRTAMTALGLALMQNKAGKGFNVGNLLTAVGEAGEKALPLADAARKEARAGQLAAGKFALAEKAKDTKAREDLAREGRNALNAINTQDLDFKQRMAIEAQKHKYQLDIEKLKAESDYETELLKQGDSGKPDLQRIKNISTIKGEQFFDVQMGYDKTSQSMKYALPQDINKIGNGYEKIIRAQNTLSDMTDLVTQIQQDPKGPALAMFIDNAKNIGVGIGLADPKKIFGDTVITVDGKLQLKQGVSRKDLLDAMRDGLIAEYKGFLTQEKGNGISNADVKKLEKLLGDLDFFGNPEEAKFRLKKVSEIFGNVESQFETILTDMGNRNMWTSEESFLQAQRNLNNVFNKGAGSDIYGLTSTLSDDGLAVYKIPS